MLRKLGVEPREGWLFSWSAAALFFVGWADVSLKNVAETFFLKRVGVEALPIALVASSGLLVVTTATVGSLVVSALSPGANVLIAHTPYSA